MLFQIPEKVNHIIKQLNLHGFEAYAVGGCVRDMVLGRIPQDWDITTSATPQEIKKIFKRTVDTGIEHGTVTVLIDKEHYEVTTYRVDGEYEDNRHPKAVSFTKSLEEDLKRRDFTINAMAYNEEQGFVDLFSGLEDIRSRVIRCVGSANERFDEDALRILRAIRFSAQLGFDIEQETMKAICVKTEKLKNISAERIRVELTKLLLSEHTDRFKLLYESGISDIILPEFNPMMTTEQNNIHHIYPVGEHTLKTIAEAASSNAATVFGERERTILRWTMLLHDIEKPGSRTVGKDGQDHFYGHSEKGAVTAKRILKRFKFDNNSLDSIVHLIRWHDYRFVLTPAGMRKAVAKIGKEYMELLFEVMRADISGKNPKLAADMYDKLNKARELYNDILERVECVSLKELEIGGKDLIEAGLKPGKRMGQILNRLLTEVIEQPQLNVRASLLERAKQMISEEAEDANSRHDLNF